MNIIFLDIDGVLNYNFSKPKKWNRSICERLNKLMLDFNYKIVITSTWRHHYTIPQLQQIFNENGKVHATAQRETHIKTPHSGWVEQDAQEIWTTQIAVVQQAMASARILAKDIKALGLTNQRETTVVWHKRTGTPLAPAIIWQDRRAAEWCNSLLQNNKMNKIHKKTGLRIDPYFSAGKLVWLLQNIDGLRELAQQGHVAFGTIDSWLIWNLT